MGLTNSALAKIGFEAIPSNVTIEAFFQSLNVYEIRGIVSDKNSPLIPADLLREDNEVSFSLGDSVNEVCRALVDDDFSDDEEKWKADNKSSPPYLIIHTKLQKKAICNDGYWQHIDDEIVTHDCFTDTKEELNKLEKYRTNSVIAALSAQLSSSKTPVVFIPLAKEVFAVTNLNKRLRDLRFTISGEAYISNPIEPGIASNKIDAALKLSHLLHPKVGYFYGLSNKEKDRLKKFLYLYLVIEIHTHQTFKELDYSGSLKSLNILPDRISESAAEFYIDRQKEAKNLTQRFMWCSILRWSEIEDKDVAIFKTLKRIRDRIYHGEEVPEETLPISEAQALASKLMRCNSYD